MRFSSTLFASAALLVASATAQTTTPTTSSPASTTTGGDDDLLGLVSQLPTCALNCLDQAATKINCTASDLTCLCSESSQLVAAIGPCLLISSNCTSSETNTIGTVAMEICSDVGSTNSSELADASRYITSALATATASSAAGSSGSSSSANLAVHTGSPMAGMGILGLAAGMAVMAL